MPGSIFYFILNMSITAALIIALIFLIRFLGRRIPRSFIYPLWGIVIFRLLVPVSVQSRISLMNLISGYMTKTVTVQKSSGGMLELSALNSVRAVNEYFPLHYKSDIIRNFFEVSGIVWVCGAAMLIISSVIIYSLTVGELKKAVLISDHDILERCKGRLDIKRNIRIYESGLVSSPVVLGIIRPRIIIPKNVPQDLLEYALLHELAHIKYFDNLFKVISVLAACIHWFNPFVWLFLYMSGTDMELACDERVLKAVSNEDKKHYARALAQLAARQQPALTAFGGTAVRMRIINIVSYRKMPLLMTAVSGIVCIALAVLLITNPM